MKYLKRAGIYKSPNVTFNPRTFEAYSYGWWRFVALVEGKIVFSDMFYSVTTRRHQYKVRQLLNELGIKIDFKIPINGIKGQTLEELIVEAEENLCDQFLNECSKQITRTERAKAKRNAYKQTKEYHDKKFNNKVNKTLELNSEVN